MNSKELMDTLDRFGAPNYARFPVVIVRGIGSRVWDAEGREYLDFVAGLAVNNLGHCHPRVVEAIKDQAERLIHVSNFYYNEPQAKLARLLIENSFADRVFFCNSGAEANEAAIKLVRKYSHESDPNRRYEIITMLNSFHGRTMATISATGQEKVRVGFDPLLKGFNYVKFGDPDELKRSISRETIAVMLEPIQGEGGVRIPLDEYLTDVRKICDDHDLALIFDEVQMGIGRTGSLFAYQQSGIEPDVMTLAKALGGGVPIGAMLAREKFASVFKPGSHASTFGGNPLVTAAGIAVIKEMVNGDIIENCTAMGNYLLECLKPLVERFGFVKEARGRGLMVALELTIDGGDIVKECIKKALLINCTMGNVLRFMPPLTVDKDEIDEMISILKDVLEGI